MQYTIYSLLKKPEYFMLQKSYKNFLVLCFLPKKSLLNMI